MSDRRLPTTECQVPIAEWEKEVEERIEAQQLQAHEVASSKYIPDRAVEAVEVALEATNLANLCLSLAREKADAIVECAAANAKLRALTGALEDDALARKIAVNENPVWTRSAGIEDYRAALREIAPDPKTEEAEDV